MLVLYKRVKTKHREFIYRTKCFYYNPSNSKKPRAVRTASTGEGKKKRNAHQKYLKIKHDCYENYDIGDWWVTLTHSIWRDPEEAEEILRRVLAKLQKKLKRKGIPFVYHKTTEASETQRVHHHLLIRNTSPELITMLLEYWNEYGRVRDVQPITDMESGKLVKYFLDAPNHKNLTYKTFGHSRNLRKPEVITRVMPVASVRENPKPPKCEEYGFKYVVDPQTIYNHDYDASGFTYQEYEIYKVRVTETGEAETATPHCRQ